MGQGVSLTRLLHYTGRREISLLAEKQQDSIPSGNLSLTFESIGIRPRLQTLITIRELRPSESLFSDLFFPKVHCHSEDYVPVDTVTLWTL